MNLQLIFRVNGAILFINGLFFLFLTEMFLGMAGFDMTQQLQTLAQAMGVSLIAVAILSWRTPDIAGSAVESLRRTCSRIRHFGGLLLLGTAAAQGSTWTEAQGEARGGGKGGRGRIRAIPAVGRRRRRTARGRKAVRRGTLRANEEAQPRRRTEAATTWTWAELQSTHGISQGGAGGAGSHWRGRRAQGPAGRLRGPRRAGALRHVQRLRRRQGAGLPGRG